MLNLMSNVSENHDYLVIHNLLAQCEMSEEEISKVEVEDLGNHTYRIEYEIGNPYDGIIDTLRVDCSADKAQVEILESAYADDNVTYEVEM